MQYMSTDSHQSEYDLCLCLQREQRYLAYISLIISMMASEMFWKSKTKASWPLFDLFLSCDANWKKAFLKCLQEVCEENWERRQKDII